jgi:hypothetical protein
MPNDRTPVWTIVLLLFVPIIAFTNLVLIGSGRLIDGGIRIYQWAIERSVRKRLRKRGRVLEERELEAKLRAGEGTLIVQDRSRYTLLWWTSDDVLRLSPVALPGGSRQLEEETLRGTNEQRYSEYVDHFVARYVDDERGCAYLTRFPKQLGDNFPEPRVVRLDQTGERPVLFHGNYASVPRP